MGHLFYLFLGVLWGAWSLNVAAHLVPVSGAARGRQNRLARPGSNILAVGVDDVATRVAPEELAIVREGVEVGKLLHSVLLGRGLDHLRLEGLDGRRSDGHGHGIVLGALRSLGRSGEDRLGRLGDLLGLVGSALDGGGSLGGLALVLDLRAVRSLGIRRGLRGLRALVALHLRHLRALPARELGHNLLVGPEVVGLLLLQEGAELLADGGGGLLLLKLGSDQRAHALGELDPHVGLLLGGVLVLDLHLGLRHLHAKRLSERGEVLLDASEDGRRHSELVKC